MDATVVGQEMTLAAPQLEVDKMAKGQAVNKQYEQISQEAFLKVLSDSMEEVHSVLNVEKEDPMDEDEEEEKEREER